MWRMEIVNRMTSRCSSCDLGFEFGVFKYPLSLGSMWGHRVNDATQRNHDQNSAQQGAREGACDGTAVMGASICTWPSAWAPHQAAVCDAVKQ